jgi:hypothetical protein
MIEQVALAVLGIALAYLISEINQMQKDIRQLVLAVAILQERSEQRRSTDKLDNV